MPRHPLFVRLTHWVNTAAVLAMVISGVAILLAHPRLYWGETGVVGEPALLDLPLPFVLTGQTGWGRSLHFLAAWVAVLNATAYLLRGTVTRHFAGGLSAYTPAQRLAYRGAIFVLAPVVLWSGLAMSPAVTAAMPSLARIVGGHQSARTIHFGAAMLTVAFACGHVVMVTLTGFTTRMRSMITGASAATGEGV